MQDAFGHALRDVQLGDTPSNTKELKGNLRGVTEIIEYDENGTFRTMYTIEMQPFVYVLGSFQKKSKSGIATPQRDLGRILGRLKAAREHYREYNRDD